MTDGIDQSEWVTYLAEFTRRNHARTTQLEVFGENGAQQEECGLLFSGISMDEVKGKPNIEIMFGNGGRAHLTHMILDVRELMPKHALDGRDEALAIIDNYGETTLLRFESLPAL
jgi:hypothetical protein